MDEKVVRQDSRDSRQVNVEQETWNHTNEALRRMAEQHKLLMQLYGSNLAEMVTGLAHQRFITQLIIKSSGLETWLEHLAQMSLVSMGLERQLSSLTQPIVESLSRITVPALDWTRFTEALQVSSAIADLVQSATIINAELLQQVQSISRSLDNVQRALAANAAFVDMARRIFEWLDFFKTLRELVEEEEKAAEAFRAAGWPIRRRIDPTDQKTPFYTSYYPPRGDAGI